MPLFKEWIVHHPSDWTPVQKQSYMQDTTAALCQALNPIMAAIGPVRTTHIIGTIIASIARVNPVYVESIKDGLANVYDLLEKMTPAAPVVKH